MKEFEYTINDTVYKVVINNIEDTVADVEVNGTPYKVELSKPAAQSVSIKRPEPSSITPISRPQQHATGVLRSPLPGTVIDIFCKEGDTVKKGQKLLVLEAMKMENAINADRDGVIKEMKVGKGDSILEGADLIIIE
jgi:biotin carboxyl carrier protein